MTSAQQRRFQEEDAEQLLGALAGVISAHIVTDDAGEMVEIHILATPEHHPKQVVRNVESALSAGLGIQVDRRIVSVAQIRTETPNGRGRAPAGAPLSTVSEADSAAAVAAAPAESEEADEAPADETGRDRLEYVRFQGRRNEERCICQVVLRSKDGEVIGSGDGPDTAAGRAEAAARAVFDAIATARPGLRLELEGATISSSRGRSYVIVAAHAVMDRTTISLAGAAALSRSPEEAAILAALQATNRWSG